MSPSRSPGLRIESSNCHVYSKSPQIDVFRIPPPNWCVQDPLKLSCTFNIPSNCHVQHTFKLTGSGALQTDVFRIPSNWCVQDILKLRCSGSPQIGVQDPLKLTCSGSPQTDVFNILTLTSQITRMKAFYAKDAYLKTSHNSKTIFLNTYVIPENSGGEGWGSHYFKLCA
jgi:hypothetical protein